MGTKETFSNKDLAYCSGSQSNIRKSNSVELNMSLIKFGSPTKSKTTLSVSSIEFDNQTQLKTRFSNGLCLFWFYQRK